MDKKSERILLLSAPWVLETNHALVLEALEDAKNSETKEKTISYAGFEATFNAEQECVYLSVAQINECIDYYYFLKYIGIINHQKPVEHQKVKKNKSRLCVLQ